MPVSSTLRAERFSAHSIARILAAQGNKESPEISLRGCSEDESLKSFSTVFQYMTAMLTLGLHLAKCPTGQAPVITPMFQFSH